MILLEGGSQRPKGRGVSFFPPDPELSPGNPHRCCSSVVAMTLSDGRMKWTGHVDELAPGSRTCSPCPGHDGGLCARWRRRHSAAPFEKKGLTRVVLASCVCCPHDFVCSACTDQRSKAQDTHFFAAPASAGPWWKPVTCAVRYLRRLPRMTHPRCNPNDFKGLIGRSINRARHLKPLPAPMRDYNFTTAIIGESEAAVFSATNPCLIRI